VINTSIVTHFGARSVAESRDGIPRMSMGKGFQIKDNSDTNEEVVPKILQILIERLD